MSIHAHNFDDSSRILIRDDFDVFEFDRKGDVIS